MSFHANTLIKGGFFIVILVYFLTGCSWDRVGSSNSSEEKRSYASEAGNMQHTCAAREIENNTCWFRNNPTQELETFKGMLRQVYPNDPERADAVAERLYKRN